MFSNAYFDTLNLDATVFQIVFNSVFKMEGNTLTEDDVSLGTMSLGLNITVGTRIKRYFFKSYISG